MIAFFSDFQSAHTPAIELQNGELVPHAESQARVEAILDVLPERRASEDFGEAPIRAVHDPAYVDFLKRAHADWRADGMSMTQEVVSKPRRFAWTPRIAGGTME